MDQPRIGFCSGECLTASAVASALDRVLEMHPYSSARGDGLVEALRAAIDPYLRPFHNQRAVKRVVVSTQKELISVPVITIRYFESSGHQQLMYLEDRQEPVPISSKMQKLETGLASEGFLRIHQGYLVNGLFVDRIGSGAVLMTGGERLPISRSKRPGLKSRCLELRRQYGDILL